MPVAVRLIFADSSYDTTLPNRPKLGDVIDIPTDKGTVRLQIKQIDWVNLQTRPVAELRFYDPPLMKFTPQSPGFDLFAAYPEFRNLGRERLQSLCRQWLSSPVAREAWVTDIHVGEDYFIAFKANIGQAIAHGEVYHFPADDLLRFLAESSANKQEQKAILERISVKRRTVGSTVYQRFSVSHPV